MQAVWEVYCVSCKGRAVLDDSEEYYRCVSCGRIMLPGEENLPLFAD